MKSNLLRFAASSLSLVLLLGMLTACDKKDNSSKTDNSGNSNSGSASSADEYLSEEELSKLRGTSIRYPFWQTPDETNQAVINSFEKKYGIKVNVEIVPQDQYITNISGKIASGSAPDVYWSNDDFPACLTCLQPIEASKIDLNDSLWDKTVSDISTIGGKAYLVNAIGNSGRDICFYNKKLLNDNNIKTPDDYLEEDNWTWETMTKLMRQVSSLGTGYYGAYVDMETFWGSAGVSFYPYKDGKFSSGLDDNLTKAMTQLSSWLNEGLMHGVGYDYRDEFNKGKVGLAITNDYGLQKKGYWGSMDPAHIGYTSIPDIDKNTKAHETGLYQGWGICKGASNPVAGGLFIRYYSNVANYDLSNRYITSDAMNYSLRLKSGKTDNTYHSLMTGSSQVLGQDRFTYWKLAQNDPKQIKQQLESMANQVKEGVNRLNARMESVAKGE